MVVGAAEPGGPARPSPFDLSQPLRRVRLTDGPPGIVALPSDYRQYRAHGKRPGR
jgi:hypothetical protein